jgi:multicomponent Na+:H+ antiporter subunit C
MFFQNYLGAILLFLIGLLGILRHRNLIRILLSLGLMESATFLMLISLGYRAQGTAPIFYESTIVPGQTVVVDPIMQALTLTSIVIGVVTLAMALSITIHIARHYRTLDTHRIRDLRG